eukprot:14261932-Heterocapsa_arctica.AAC.1
MTTSKSTVGKKGNSQCRDNHRQSHPEGLYNNPPSKMYTRSEMWCKEKGYNIENIAGDGNCLYASLGRSRNLTGHQVRQIIHDRPDSLWRTHMEHDADESELG